MEMAEKAWDGGGEDSSDSDVAIVLPQKPKRRRLLPGTVPIVAAVYSNKVNRSLKLLPDAVSTVAEMEKELQKTCKDPKNEETAVPLPVKVPTSQSSVLSDTEDVEFTRASTRNSSPSPPPTPNTPVRKIRRGQRGLNRKIRKMEACLQDLGTVLSPIRSQNTEDNDVIVMGTSTVPELTIKVRRRGKIFRINIRMTDPLQRLVEMVALHLEVDPSQIMLLRGDEELNTKETAISLNITVADIIDCMVLSRSGGDAGDGEHTEEICLKVQGKDKQSQLTVTIGKNQPLKFLMDQYQNAMGLSKKVCFMFEGQKLKGKSTADQLGLESDDIIEAWT